MTPSSFRIFEVSLLYPATKGGNTHIAGYACTASRVARRHLAGSALPTALISAASARNYV